MKLVGYIRVSTDRQAEEGLGLEVQEDSLRSWARSNGHRVAKVLRDEGISGSNGIETRVGSRKPSNCSGQEKPGAWLSTGWTASRATSYFRSSS